MSDTKKDQIDRITRYANLIQKQTGKAVRPYRADGYVNLMNKYGTSKDASEQYRFVSEGIVDDDTLSVTYEGNGLFARIIDTPAEEAVKHGFTLKNINDESVEEFYMSALDELDWDETAITCLKWARLFGGSLAVMLINDGRGVEEPLDWRNIKSIDDIRVYDRSVVQPDYSSMYSYDPTDPFGSRGSRFGMPEYYYVSSVYGSFTVHESRCLVFQNGVLPERTSNSVYRLWGMPEYVRIHRAMRDAEIAHGSAVKMLDRSVQAVYKMKDLAMELATEEGENRVLRRLQIIDMARGLLNSITIDGEGEDYDFRTFQFTGVSDIINATCNYLSALTSIPQTILFGRSPAGMNATGESDMETYYNFVERIQKRSLRSNLRYLLSVIFQAGVATGEIEKVPNINVQFNPLWSMSDAEKADLELKNAQAKQTKAATASLYIQDQVLSAEEVRKSLVKSGDFDVDATFDDDEDEESMAEMIQKITENGGFAPNSGGSSPDAAPAATKLPQDMNDGDLAEASVANAQSEQEPTIGLEAEKTDDAETSAAGKGNLGSVGVLVVKDGKILVAVRKHDVGNGLICGPGGHIEPGETPIMAAARETSEEFGIIPNELIPIGNGPAEPETGYEPYIFLCTDYDGEPVADGDEMSSANFMSLEELEELSSALFAPFADSLKFLLNALGGEDRKDAADNDVEWITVNGTHIPLDESGKAIGGPSTLQGKNFSGSKNQTKSASTGKPAARRNIGTTDFSEIESKLLNGSKNDRLAVSPFKQLTPEEFERIKKADTPDKRGIQAVEKTLPLDSLYSTQPTNNMSRLQRVYEHFQNDPESLYENIARPAGFMEPPNAAIRVWKINGKNVIADGNHRLCIMHALGETEAKVEYYDLDRNENEDGGPGSGNFGHEGRPGEVGGSAPEDGPPATPDSAREAGRCLMKITKRRFNDGVARLVEESGYKVTDEGRKKVMDMLDEFEPGSTITYPESGAYGEKVAFIKQEDGTWRAFDADYSADEIADDFFETEDRRPVASKSAESKEERDYYSALSQKANWRNNEQIWKKDGSFSKTTEIKLQKTDLDHAGIGMKVVGADGTEYEKLEDGWYKAGTYEKADMRKIGHPKIQADFFAANFGLNGISVDECARMRELYDGMPDKLRTQYEDTFRTAEFAPSLRGCSYCSQSTVRIYFDMDSSAETILHETAHAFDKGVINKDADVGNGFGTVHISSASQNIDFILDYQDGRNDFEAMAKVVGISTNGEGWFSQELQDDSSARISAFVKFSGKYESMEDFECVSDAISGMTLDMMGESFLGGGHSQSYWQQPYGGEMASNQSCEYWANFCTLMAKGNTRALTLLKDISPARYAACLKTYEEAFGDE